MAILVQISRIGPSVVFSVLLAGAVDAQTTLQEPRQLVLPDQGELTLPGDKSGAAFGVKVRRGSGFPPRIVAEDVSDDPDEVVSEPATPPTIVRRPRRSGY